jgi:Cof subfamily protein (haloacid dehalogenase superfamily)
MKRKFNPQNIKALALDLDGTTLLPDAVLGEYTIKILKELISKGMQVFFATGRTVESSAVYLNAINADGPMVFSNGAEIAEIPSGKILHSNLVGLDVVDFGVDIARSMGIHYQIYLPAGISPEDGSYSADRKQGTLLIEKQGSEAERYLKHTGIIPVVKDLKKFAALPGIKGCIKSMFIAEPHLHDQIRQKLINRFGSTINIIRSSPVFLEILNSGASKGEGLKIVMKLRGLCPDEVIAFGDEENDLSMFEAAGFAVATLNSKENVLKAADLIIGSNTEEGLASYLEKAFLY